MIAHLRSNLLLLILTVVICAVLYPLTLLVVGNTIFPDQVRGSIVNSPHGGPIGSLLVAQEFKGNEWFRPRPSAASYNGAASSGSNWGANNPKLRDRAAQILGPMVRYRPGTGKLMVQEEMESWLTAKPTRLVEWSKKYPTSAGNWLSDAGNAKAIAARAETHPGDFWETFAAQHPSAFPVVENDKIIAISRGAAVHAMFFDMWLQDHPDHAKDLEAIPADAVTASGSGLDPHITLRNAKQQLDRIADEWAAKRKLDRTKVLTEVKEILERKAFRPLAGLAGGEPLVNVLEVNLELVRWFAGRERSVR